MSVDKAEQQNLQNLMINAEKTGNWEAVANDMNQHRAGDFANRDKDMADTVKAAADYCDKHGFPTTVILGTDGHVQSIKDEKNSSFLHKVGVSEDKGGSYQASDKL